MEYIILLNSFLNGIANIYHVLTSNTSIFIFFTIIGMVGHYAKKKVNEEIDVTFKDWFLDFKVYSTILTIVTALITIFGALSNNIINDSMSVSTIIYVGLTTGFAIDSLTNTDT